jgi:hypothetical protein
MEHKHEPDTTCKEHLCSSCKQRFTNDYHEPCKTCLDDNDKCCYESED